MVKNANEFTLETSEQADARLSGESATVSTLEYSGDGTPDVTDAATIERNIADHNVADPEITADLEQAKVISAEIRRAVGQVTPVFKQQELQMDSDERTRKLITESRLATAAYDTAVSRHDEDQSYINAVPEMTFMEKVGGVTDGLLGRALPTVKYGINKFLQVVSGYPLMSRGAKDKWNKDMEIRDSLEKSAAEREHRRNEREAESVKSTRIINRTREVQAGKAPHQQR